MPTGPSPRKLSDQVLSDLLARRSFGTLATIRRNGAPHLTTMIYRWDASERIARFFTTADRVKVAHIRANPHAALHVPGPDVWSFAVAEGTAEVSEVTRQAGDKIGQEIWAIVPQQMRPENREVFFRSLVEERRVVIRLTVDRLYGSILDQS